MENNFTIDEILNAVNDLHQIKKDKKNVNSLDNIEKKIDANIPKNTLRLIEEAEKSKNS